MNKSNIKTLLEISQNIEDIIITLSTISDPIRERLDNASEKFIESDKGEILENDCTTLETTIDTLQECIENLSELT